MSVSKLLTLSTLFFLSNASLALSPVVPPPIPPDVRLTIDMNVNGLFGVYRSFERAATKATF